MSINPVELISHSRSRIARIAAIGASAYVVAPALTAIALAALLPVIGALTWNRMGYLVSPDVMSDARLALMLTGFIAVMIGAFLAARAYRASDDFIGAAIRVDQRVHGNEQVVTLATLSLQSATWNLHSR